MNSEDNNMQKYLITSNKEGQLVYMFPNGFGASVISDGYGSKESLKEMALLKFKNKEDYSLAYDDNEFQDVAGYLDKRNVDELLQYIKDLPTTYKTRNYL